MPQFTQQIKIEMKFTVASFLISIELPTNHYRN